jgi:hypothetical protein
MTLRDIAFGIGAGGKSNSSLSDGPDKTKCLEMAFFFPVPTSYRCPRGLAGSGIL